MNIQPNIAFTAKIKISELKQLSKEAVQLSPFSTTGSCAVGSTSAGTLGTTASNVAGSASDVLGTAFSAKASGIDSFGIVPSSLDAVAPYVTPKTIISANNNPSTMGSLFSTIGSFLHDLGKSVTVTKKVKDPS